MIYGAVGKPPTIVSHSLNFGGRKNITSGRSGKEVELQMKVNY